MEPFLFKTMLLPSSSSTRRTSLYRTMPSNLDLIWGCLKTWEAVPPMWKVRMVNWVPGSPMDWAAMMPTASPRLIMPPVARLRP